MSLQFAVVLRYCNNILIHDIYLKAEVQTVAPPAGEGDRKPRPRPRPRPGNAQWRRD